MNFVKDWDQDNAAAFEAIKNNAVEELNTIFDDLSRSFQEKLAKLDAEREERRKRLGL